MEIVFSIGILATALLTLLSVSSIALRYHRQSINTINAARVTDMVLNRSINRVIAENPPAALQAAFFGTDYAYPASPYDTGSVMVGREEYFFAIYAVTIPGIGDPAAAPVPNVLKKVDAYVWWTTGEAGDKRSFATRLVNQGEQP